MAARVSDIQNRLLGLGYDPGPADGILGPRTLEAIMASFDGAATVKPDLPATPAPKPPSGLMQAGKYPVTEIIVHCAATRPEWMADLSLQEKRAEIRRWHLANGWRDIGYHWLIDRDGKVIAGRAETEVGAHVQDHNAGTIGICLIGGFGAAATDRFAQHYTAAQDVTLRQMIQAISMRARITRISGHNQYADKACPGFSVPGWLAA